MSELDTLAREGMAVNLVAASCLTILLYDHAITLDEEIDKMWPTRLSFAKFLFFMNRYFVEAILLFNCISASRPYESEKVCVFYLRWLTIASTISTSVVQGILVLRVWALHRHNKLIIYIAFFFYFGGIAVLAGLVIKDYVGEDVFSMCSLGVLGAVACTLLTWLGTVNRDLASLPGCYATSVPSIIAGFWIGPLIVETVMFVLVVSRAYTWWTDGMDLPKIFVLLARDSALYFLIVFSFLLANFLLFQLGPPFLSSLLVTPSTTAGCILGSHMILNLRTAIAAQDEDSIVSSGKSLRWSAGPNQDVTRPTQHDTNAVMHITRGENIEFAVRGASALPGKQGAMYPSEQGYVPDALSPFGFLDRKNRERDEGLT
ncbi:hypothetical protein HYPSUDRAFT_666394 [Hypholoma sublateritium FD-334 SS-4]|uniref:DUF6533 domain-containing protein n=1 Tax=Hypholoma sublateritium (strain FD-334 SS-4) TaxID=945553 RepID=A0A0D2PQL5_HYPSF|nr:hypothetical protein HYPSUDRAFT_666394 [Hypholoma sublateritium FD-334 SS-4]